MDNLDIYITNIVSKKINEPPQYEQAIKNAFKTKKTYYYKLKFIHAVSVLCSIIILLSGMVYAKQLISNYFNTHQGMNAAIDNNYIDEPNLEFIKSNVSSNNNIFSNSNTEITVKNMLMDDLNISFTFSIKFDNKIDISKIKDLKFPDMIITDENKNIIYCESKDIFEKYCNENNLDHKYLNFNSHYMNNETNTYIKSNENNIIDFIFNISTSTNSYPNSKKLNINISQINLSEREIYDNEETIIEGNWNIKFNVAEKFYNRETSIYTVKSCSDNKIDITEACLYNTGFVFEFTSNDEPIYDESDSEEVKREKGKLFFENRSNGNNFINNEYIESTNGEKFYPVNSNVQTSGTIYEVNGNFKHWQTFDLIPSVATNNLLVYINLNLHGYQRDVVIELERK